MDKVFFKAMIALDRYFSRISGITINKYSITYSNAIISKNCRLMEFSVPSEGKIIGIGGIYVGFRAGQEEGILINFTMYGFNLYNPIAFKIMEFIADQSMKKGPFFRFLKKWNSLP